MTTIGPTARRLAGAYPLETLRRMRISAGIALDRAEGRAIQPARRRCWTLDDAIETALAMPSNQQSREPQP